MAGGTLRAEIESIVSFLCKTDPRTFKRRAGEWDSFEIVDDPREAILLASLVPDSFFLREKNNSPDPPNTFQIKLELDFAGGWASDTQVQYPQVFEGNRRVVKFVPFWIPTYDLGKSALRRRKARTLEEARQFVHDSGLDMSECLFLPYYEYRSKEQSGSDIYQLGEGIYHYLAGLVFKEWGYLVCNEYVLSKYSGERPDLCAFKTDEIEQMLAELRKRGMIRAGAFMEELQLFNSCGKVSYKPRSLDSFEPPTDAQVVVIEVERSRSQRKGRSQLQGYLLGTQGLFDQGYLSGPFLDQTKGTITLSKEGELSSQRAEPAYRPTPLPEHLIKKRKEQLEEIRANLRMQLFKNLPFQRILSVCEGGNEVQTYQGLLNAMITTELGSVLDALESG